MSAERILKVLTTSKSIIMRVNQGTLRQQCEGFRDVWLDIYTPSRCGGGWYPLYLGRPYYANYPVCTHEGTPALRPSCCLPIYYDSRWAVEASLMNGGMTYPQDYMAGQCGNHPEWGDWLGCCGVSGGQRLVYEACRIDSDGSLEWEPDKTFYTLPHGYYKAAVRVGHKLLTTFTIFLTDGTVDEPSVKEGDCGCGG